MAPAIRMLVAAVALFLTFRGSGLPRGYADEPVLSSALAIDQAKATDVRFELSVSGHMITPSADGQQRFPLRSTGKFDFRHDPFPTELGGPFTLRAVRQFRSAGMETSVGEDHVTKTKLATAYQTVHVFGSDTGLQIVSPRYALTRQQLDMLQMPFDIMVAGNLLPLSAVQVGEKWNTDAWVVSLLSGVEAVVKQSATCELKSLSAPEAVVAFSGDIEGAVNGSSTQISFSGELTLDRKAGLIRTMKVTQNEKRSPGPVSPGLDVTATMQWDQTAADTTKTIDRPKDPRPTDKQLLLFLQTPQKLQLFHGREWHLFHETPAVLMMRQHRNGNFIAQCNISAAVTVPPKEHTPDQEFLSDVQNAVSERKGRVGKEETVRDDERWRIRHIQAVGDASGEVIIWDYYLCSAVTGEQYSLVFSHSKSDEAEFAGSAEAILSSLQVARRRPALPFQ